MTEPTPLPRPIVADDKITTHSEPTLIDGVVGSWVEWSHIERANAAIAAGAQYEYIAAERLSKITEYQARHDADQRLIEHHRTEFETVAAALLDEAVAREWCSDYDEFVAQVNAGLRHNKLTVRDTSWIVEHRYTVVVTGTVVAPDQANAERLAQAQYNQIVEHRLFNQPNDTDINDSLDFSIDELTYQHDSTDATYRED
jgi:hypothetical protein